MRISTVPDGSQCFSYISDENKINNNTKVSEVEATGIQLCHSSSLPSAINSIQEVNMTIQRLMQHVRIINLSMDELLSKANEIVAQTITQENNSSFSSDLIKIAEVRIGEPQLPMFHADLEEMTVTLVQRMNEVLRVISEASAEDITPDKGAHADNNGLKQLREIIFSGWRVQEEMNNVFKDFSSLGIKLMHDGLFSIDRQFLKEAISSNGVEVARTVKTVAGNIFEILPICIDPSSGTLIYTGKRLEDDGNDKASKVLAAIDEELEKEKTELDNRLSRAELLISYSSKLIDDLKPQSEALLAEE
jgi:hypothetical protein